MTRLFAIVRDALEAGQVARAGFDGVAADDPALDASPLPILRPAPGPGLCLHLEGPEGQHSFRRFDDEVPDEAALDVVKAAGTDGVLVAASGRLIDQVGIAGIGALRGLCAVRGLLLALAGGLEAPDAPRLMALAPDFLVVGRALRDGSGALDAASLALLRDLVPREGARAATGSALAARRVADLIFLRDLVLPIAIGAYAEERDRKQRVRFSVEAELRDSGRPTRDMRDVVSYDLFSDAIAALTTGRHVDFVETLAEEIAAAVLVHPRIRRVRVTVEKLDVGPGAVGVTIERREGE